MYSNRVITYKKKHTFLISNIYLLLKFKIIENLHNNEKISTSM